MVPTEDFEIKETVVFARCSFRVCRPSNLCVLVSKGYLLRRPLGVVEGIQVKRRIKSVVGGLSLAELQGWRWCGCRYDEVIRKVVV